MTFDRNLLLNTKSLVADIETSIINGELNDFEPMMKLSKFVEEESLAQMRFSRMTNNIRIENRVIHLPEMEIRSNISNILVKGQHSFDKNIDYRLQVPLKNLLRITRKQNFDQSARQGMNLMLKISGTTSDYAVSFDSQALKESIKNDILTVQVCPVQVQACIWFCELIIKPVVSGQVVRTAAVILPGASYLAAK